MAAVKKPRQSKRKRAQESASRILDEIDNTLALISSLQGNIRNMSDDMASPDGLSKLVATISRAINDLARTKLAYEKNMRDEAASYTEAQKTEALIEWLLSKDPRTRAAFLRKLEAAETGVEYHDENSSLEAELEA